MDEIYLNFPRKKIRRQAGEFRNSVVVATWQGPKEQYLLYVKRKTRMDAKEKKEYHRLHDKSVIKIRVNAHEKTLLDIAMKDDGWENISGYVKYRLFGINPKTKLKKKIVSTQNKDNVRTYLSNLIQQHDMKIEMISSHLQSQCNNEFNERQTRNFYANILKEIFKMQDELKFMQQILSEQNDKG